MARHPADLASEFEEELEDEFEAEFEDEQHELRGFQSEFEDEFEDEDEGFQGEFEDEFEDEDEYEGEEFLGGLGGIARLAGSLLGQGEGEDEFEGEDEAEEFFGRIGRALKKAAPFLKVLAKTAGPLVATAVGGPAAGALARAVTSQLEGEAEDELEAMAASPVSGGQSMAEYYAARAAASESETEAEAFTGAASYLSISARDRRELERMLPSLLRGSAVLTRLLHTSRHTRQAVRLVPGIVDGTARTLARRVAAGDQVGPVEVGQVLGGVTSRVLGDPRSRSTVMRRHAQGLARARRHRGRAGGYGYGGGGGWGYRGRRPGRGYRTGWAYPAAPGGPRRGVAAGRRGGWYGPGRPAGTVRRAPARSQVVASRGRVPSPRPGFVRVVTPVRVPPQAGQAPRVVRVVSDVRVPRGAVAAGRPTTVRARR
jgi:hypothetical protein